MSTHTNFYQWFFFPSDRRLWTEWDKRWPRPMEFKIENTFETQKRNKTWEEQSKESTLYVDYTERLLRGEEEVQEPIRCMQTKGTKLYDLLSAFPLFLLSQRVIEAFEAHKVTGWRKYPVRLGTKKQGELTTYWALGITGRGGECDRFNSENTQAVWIPMDEGVSEEEAIKRDRVLKYLKGYSFDSSQWDGSDIFLLGDALGKLITQKVRDILVNMQATNMCMERISEVLQQDLQYLREKY